MADLRVLKLALLAETKDFVKGLDAAEKNTKSFSQKLSGAVKKTALAFAALGAAAGAAAIKIGKDAVKAAIEDEQSQKQLARALKNSTNATDAQIASTEKYITKIQNQTGLQDGDLRESFASLIRVTKDHTKAQELQAIAIDVAAGTGKDLNTVTEALSRAYGGNLTALQRLDPSLKELIQDGATTDEVFTALGKTFGGAAADAADTFAGRMEIIKRRVEDAQKALGFVLLPILEKVSTFIVENVVPAIEGLVRGFTGGPRSVDEGVFRAGNSVEYFGIQLNESESAGYDLGTALRDLTETIKELFKSTDDGTNQESGLVRFLDLITRIIDGIDRFIARIDSLKAKIKEFNDAWNNSLIGQFANATGVFAPENAPGRLGSQRSGGATVGSSRNPQINFYIRGNPDPQAAGREIVNVINQTTATTGIRVGIPGR